MRASDLTEVLGLIKARSYNLVELQSINEKGSIDLRNENRVYTSTLDNVPAAVWDAIRDAIRARNAPIDKRLAELGVEPDV